MVEIRTLTHPDNVTLVRGATQHWSDLERGALGAASVVAGLISAQVHGRCLVVGPVDLALLADVSARAESVDAVVRSIPDSATYGERLPEGRVWCGDVADLPAEASGYDTIVCADLASVLPLESEARPWGAILTDVTDRLSPTGTVVLAVENDLGLHRLTATHNPRLANSDADWNVLATWDASRPRTADAAAASLGGATAWALGPSFPDVRSARRLDTPRGALADVVAWHTAAWPLRGPDPSWRQRSYGMAGQADALASGWLLVLRPTEPTHTALAATLVEQGPVTEWREDGGSGTPLLALLADGCASHDLPTLRGLLRAWREAVEGRPVDPSPSLVLSGPDGMTGVVEASGSATLDDLWAALATFVAIVRGRHWRHPWPSTMDDADLLRAIGAMAGLPEPSRPVREFVIAAPSARDPFDALDEQQLVAAIDRNNETIRTLRSRLAWTELQYVSHKVGDKAVRTARRVAGKGKRVAKGVLRRLRG